MKAIVSIESKAKSTHRFTWKPENVEKNHDILFYYFFCNYRGTIEELKYNTKNKEKRKINIYGKFSINTKI